MVIENIFRNDDCLLNFISCKIDVIPYGRNAGKLGTILTLGGCSLSCRWCAYKDTWYCSLSNDKYYSDLHKLLSSSLKETKIVYITGGEPLEQYTNLMVIVYSILSNFKNVLIEIDTSGLVDGREFKKAFLQKPIRFVCDLKLPSSEVYDKVKFDWLTFLDKNDDLIIPIAERSDVKEFIEIKKKYKFNANLYIMAVYRQMSYNDLLPLIIENKLNDCHISLPYPFILRER